MWLKMITNSLSETISDFIIEILNIISDPIVLEGVMEKYEVSVVIGKSLIGVSLLYAIVAYRFSFDLFETSKIKSMIKDLMLAGLILNFGDFFIKSGNELAGIIAEGWYGQPEYLSGIGKVILESIGITITGLAVGGAAPVILPGLGIAVLVILGLALVFILILLLTSIISASVLEIMFVILPVILGFYPLKYGKKFLEKWLTLYIGILSIPPVQGLAISLLFTSTASEVTFLTALFALGKLIVVVLIVPGLMLYIFSTASSLMN